MASPELQQWMRTVAGLRGSLAVVGSGKNAGKTTLLNFLLRHLPPPRTGVTSIGRDGEKLDSVESLPKPSIHLAPGSLFATARQCLSRCKGRWSVLQKTPLSTPLGPVSICRAESDSLVELAGSPRAAELAALFTAMHSLGADLTLADGAFDRAASVGICQWMVAAAGSAGKPDVQAASLDAWALANRCRLQQWEEKSQSGLPLLKMNALLDGDLEGLIDCDILLPGPASCFLGPVSWRRIEAARIRIWVQQSVPLLGLFVSAFRPHHARLDAQALLAQTRQLCPEIPVFDLSIEGELLTRAPFVH